MQAKTKKKLLIVGWLAVFLLLVTTFSSVTVAYATVTQCSDGIDNDSDGRIDTQDSLCHTDGNLYNPASYDPSLDAELGTACVQTCSYLPKAGRIIVEFDRINKIKSNGTLTESKTPAVSVSIPAGYYNISMNGIDGCSSRASNPAELNEIWKAFLMSGSELTLQTAVTTDLSDGMYCSEQMNGDTQTIFFVAKDIDSVVAQHAAYPDTSSSNDLWPVCIALDRINQPPVIVLLGSNPMTLQLNTVFTDPGASSTDPEDGNLTSSIIPTGTVNTSATGTYSVLYTVTDSGGLIATTSRTVNVVLATTTNQAPVITIIGGDSLEVFVGDAYSDQGATALDFEDGNITNKVITTSTVNISIAGTYNVFYNATDSQNLAAVEKVRTVVVKTKPSGCVGSCGGGGGGGGVSYSTSLIIFDEKVESQSTTTALVTWKTDTSADSRVVYSTSSVNSVAMSSVNYGYVYTTITSSTLELNHSMLITGLLPGTNYYFRPVSDNPYVNPVVGKELSLIISHVPQVITSAPVECNYLLEYLRIDLPNNPVEVVKLQKFLKENEGFTSLTVNGVFDQATSDAVDIFQMRYPTDVLSPWGYAYNHPTSYVYITTKKKVNELYCKRPFPLTQEQIDEIISVRNEGSFLQTSPSSTTTLGITEPIPNEPITTEPSQTIGQTEPIKPIQGLVTELNNEVSDENQEEQKSQEQSIFTASILSNIPSAKTFLVIALILTVLLAGLIIFFVLMKRRKRIVNAEELLIQ